MCLTHSRKAATLTKRKSAIVGIPACDGESLEEYIQRAGQMAVEDNLAICATIDRTVGKGYVSPSTVNAPKVIENTINARYNARKKTIADLAAENPLIAAMLRAGL